MASSSFFTNNDFMPHGMCYLWQADILWTSVISDVLTALAYFSITIAVITFVRRRKDLPYPWFFLLAGSVIFVACGTSHLVSAIVIWEPIYGISAIVKAVTAITSLATGIVIWVVLPFFLRFPSPSMLTSKNEKLQDTLDKLKSTQISLVESRKMASLGGLVAGVAHEINTPLGVALTATSQLEDLTEKLASRFKLNNITRKNFEQFIDNAGDCIELISRNLNRTADLVSSFKEVAVDQSNNNLRLYNLKDYVSKILASLKPVFKDTSYQLALNCQDDTELWGDPGDIAQIITNLVMNSLIHGFENADDGSINIEITTQDQNIIFTYKDSGCGMNMESTKQIFEPFFTTKRGKGGSGLGMHIVFNLVTQSLKGTIDCVSDLGKGTQFILKFPLDKRNDLTAVIVDH